MFGFKKKNTDKESDNQPERVSLSDRLQRTRSGLFGEFFNRKKTVIDEATIEDLEDRLIMADIGMKTTDQVIQLLKAESKKKSDTNPIEQLKQ